MEVLRSAAIVSLLFVAWAMEASGSSKNQNEAFETFVEEFTIGYKDLNIPKLELSYVDNLKLIQPMCGLDNQAGFFADRLEILKTIDREALPEDKRYQYDTLLYEITLNQERLVLERQWQETYDGRISEDGIATIPQGKQWYQYFIKRWTTVDLPPDEIFQFGLSEVKRVQAEISKIQEELGFAGRDAEFYAMLNGPEFVITDEQVLREGFADLQKTVKGNFASQFLLTDFKDVGIAPIPDVDADSPPGYFKDDTFFFNFLNNKFPKRNLEWLFMHEATPGHYFQKVTNDHITLPTYAELFWYPAHNEGWAAYIENIGKDVGAYADIYQYLGKWEWDLVRSARLVLDVGMNYYGWTREKAAAFWDANIKNQDAIKEREINRVVRWPVQVFSYKIGEYAVKTLKDFCQQQQGQKFDVRKFHEAVLALGSVPIGVMQEKVVSACR